MDATSKRLDHLGIVKGTIDELGIVDLINDCIGVDTREEITTGEAVAGMILNGLGFVSKPLSLSPVFFKSKALELLFKPGIKAENFNSSKLSKSLDKVRAFGLERLFFILSSSACSKAGVNVSSQGLDTTTLSLHGEYDTESDEHTINVAHGYSKDRRPDLKQIVQELVVSQDGGVPLMMKTWDGNASDSEVFKQRTKEVINNLNKLELKDNYLIADSKLYTSENAENLSKINFITRVPNSISLVGDKILEANKADSSWELYDEDLKYKQLQVEHYGIEQRWCILMSKSSKEKATRQVTKLITKERELLESARIQGSKIKHCSPDDALKHIDKLEKKLKLYDVSNVKVYSKGYYNKSGKPKKGSNPDYEAYHVDFEYKLNTIKQKTMEIQKSCFVIASNAYNDQITAHNIILKYKNQNSTIENIGFRFLKDPLFFTSSLFVKSPSRIESMVFIMTLSLLIYSIAQRKLQQNLSEQEETIPDQMNRPSKKPTLRWVFQLFEGINFIKCCISNTIQYCVDGINDVHSKIISLLGGEIQNIYEGKNFMSVT